MGLAIVCDSDDEYFDMCDVFASRGYQFEPEDYGCETSCTCTHPGRRNRPVQITVEPVQNTDQKTD